MSVKTHLAESKQIKQDVSHTVKLPFRSKSLIEPHELFLLARPSQDVFLLPLIPWIEQGGSLLRVTLMYDLCDGLTIFKLNGRNEYRSPTTQNLATWRSVVNPRYHIVRHLDAKIELIIFFVSAITRKLSGVQENHLIGANFRDTIFFDSFVALSTCVIFAHQWKVQSEIRRNFGPEIEQFIFFCFSVLLKFLLLCLIVVSPLRWKERLV